MSRCIKQHCAVRTKPASNFAGRGWRTLAMTAKASHSLLVIRRVRGEKLRIR